MYSGKSILVQEQHFGTRTVLQHRGSSEKGTAPSVCTLAVAGMSGAGKSESAPLSAALGASVLPQHFKDVD